MRILFAIVLLLLAAACSEHPLAGTWAPEGKPATKFEFQKGGDKLMVHVDDADGHTHAEESTYTWADGKLSLRYKLHGVPYAWSGAFANGKLELESADRSSKMTLVPTTPAH